MSRHLNEDQISAVVAGDHNREISTHLGNCAVCRQKIEQLESLLGHFRGAVREWGDRQFTTRAVVQPRTRFWPALAYGAGVAFIVLLSVIGYRFSTRPTVNPVAAPSALQSDTLLLNHVKADVSRSVPPGMETLLGFNATESEQR